MADPVKPVRSRPEPAGEPADERDVKVAPADVEDEPVDPSEPLNPA